ncbi:hypothetical protein JQ620_21365 [Bradyrhizobium sp. AUGA SZCCT0274]|uniref:hypothetical protein n=1 Tax=unclassified Bradyrhizobium TaxID=2631580 RepID=UPI001BA9E7AA|nr:MULTISPECIES: hypothetical protein [unclassified Bradyrhizobium]MBR1195696.1 hypothetical protein [Bradyrhizobium sp. AUGA SZCCT0158]MBR1242663.1 hypothetical protein [Bradyrhizobium sp. AUGA SZCCT0274]
MKLLIRDYVASLKERQELDAILPDLLSELGFHVISRPGRGTAQRGVDVAAVGKDSRGKQKVYLFTIKPGDLTRQEWDGTSQKVRSSLNEIIDEYIPTRIPAAYRKLKVVIVLCFGGDVHESARSLVTQFTRRHTTRSISFEEWNGDKIAELLLTGVLREELLPKPLRSSFQKAVAMVDQPDIAYEHFALLLAALRNGITTGKDAVRVSRQMYICLWVLFVWARDIDNLDAPYRCSELVLLNLWEIVKPSIGKGTVQARSQVAVVQHTINLHIQIGTLLIERKIFPHVDRRNALSAAVATRTHVDINLKMFDMLGRIAMTGHWMVWVSSLGGPIDPDLPRALDRIAQAGMQMIQNNPALFLPLKDEQAIEVALFLMYAVRTGAFDRDIHAWLHEMAQRFQLAVHFNSRYPCRFADYEDLIEHPKDGSDEYRNDALAGSILIPLLAAWLAAAKDRVALDRLTALKADYFKDCTLQLWLPGRESENHLYLNDEMHGDALTDLPVEGDGAELLQSIVEACEANEGFMALSANRTGYWPVVLTACRHYRLPIPPQFWIATLTAPEPTVSTETSAAPDAKPRSGRRTSSKGSSE